MSTARVRFPASADMGFFGLEKLLSLLVSAPRHYKGRVRALHALVHLHVRTLSVWCSLKLPVCVRTHWNNCTDYKDPGYLSEDTWIRKQTHSMQMYEFVLALATHCETQYVVSSCRPSPRYGQAL